MSINILMPALSPTMESGKLVKWLKQEGDKIKPGEVIAEIETDKAVMEVESVDSGILGKIVITAGTEDVLVNSVIGVILEAGENINDIKIESIISNESAISNEKETTIREDAKIEESLGYNDHEQGSDSKRIKASPLAKKIALLNEINLANIKGSGPCGRIIKMDIENILMENKNNIHPKIVSNIGNNANKAEIIEPNNMRKVIAKRLSESKQTIPHFYLEVEVNIDKLMDLRSVINSTSETKISINDFIIKAVALSIKKNPDMKCNWTEKGIVTYPNIDVSVAVAIDNGLVTPIIFNADKENLSNISLKMKEYVIKAKEMKLAPHEFQGGCFTISNLGMFGIKSFSAIINPGQSCILAVGASKKTAIVGEGDLIKIANIMSLTLSCDHRIVDGAVGSQFLNDLKNYLEQPLNILI